MSRRTPRLHTETDRGSEVKTVMRPLITAIAGVAYLEAVIVLAMPRILPTGLLPMTRLRLPSNATSIRADIDTSFRCDSKGYGYYADVENDCQVFHVCFPVGLLNEDSTTNPRMFMWSFICPVDTVFNQEKFTCTRVEDSIPCRESARYYVLNNKLLRTGPSEDEGVVGVVSESSEAVLVEAAQPIPSREEEPEALLQNPLEVVDNSVPEGRRLPPQRHRIDFLSRSRGA